MNAINIAATGLRSTGTWLDVTANNIANANDTAPTNGQAYRSEDVQTSSAPSTRNRVGQSVQLPTVRRGSNGTQVQDPRNPMADGQGYVRSTDADLSVQMGNLIMAQRSLEATAVTIQRARYAYDAVIAMGSR